MLRISLNSSLGWHDWQVARLLKLFYNNSHNHVLQWTVRFSAGNALDNIDTAQHNQSIRYLIVSNRVIVLRDNTIASYRFTLWPNIITTAGQLSAYALAGPKEVINAQDLPIQKKTAWSTKYSIFRSPWIWV